MTRKLPSDQMRRNFEISLARALQGVAPWSHTSLGPYVEEALIDIVLTHPNASDELVTEARRQFARELTRREP